MTISGIGTVATKVNQNCEIGLDIPEQLELADPEFYYPNKIDALLGAEVFWDVINHQRFIISKNITLQGSRLGWLVTGKIPLKPVSSICNVSLKSLQKDLRKFWEIEDCQDVCETSSSTLSVSECETHFQKHVVRNEQGRFIVNVPFNEKIHKLGSSEITSTKRLLSLERKFRTQIQFKEMYSEFMRDFDVLSVFNQDAQHNIFSIGSHDIRKTLGIIFNTERDEI
ncbi:hypothetical protein PPYR_07298, partial [Photinus pyralis]